MSPSTQTPENDPQVRRSASLRILVLVGAAAALLLAGVHLGTADRIERQAEQRAQRTLTQMLPSGSFDNRPIDDRFEARIAGLDGPSTIHVARLDGRPVALLADVTTPAGYSGPIRLLVAIDPAGEVLGVRVLEHRETPGLGDRIELRRSDWIEQFDGRSLGRPPLEEWQTDRRGGEFDTLSSATITSAAVTEAVRRVLVWFRDTGQEALREQPADATASRRASER
ncbi:RnfABCDGE type electron transport complex subunit G [Halomonas denitrificans]|nr:RnfABCDGE type electron transport complex subunit G [Halomonas denitrificans]